MQRKLPGYFLLSILSFCFFTVCFHTVATAQTASDDELPVQPTITAAADPTPTIYIGPETPQLPFFGMKPPQPTKAPTPALPASPSAPEGLEALFTKFADAYHIDKEILKKIARCESGFNATSNNSGMYLGMFQFSAPTWISTRTAMGKDTNPELRTNPEEAINTAAFKISHGGIGAWPHCGK